jgi:hypothetical protein
MSGATPTYGFPYPTANDTPSGYTQIQALAVSLEAKITAMDAILNAQIATRFLGTSAPGTDQVIGTSETIMDERVTFTAVSGHKYLILHTADNAIASGSPTAATYNYRYAAGASLTTGGTLLRQYIGPPPSGAHTTDERHTTFTAPSSGVYTVGCGYLTNGAATVRFFANSKQLTVIDIT